MKRSASTFQHGDVKEKSPVFGYWEPAPEPTIDAKGTLFGLREVLDVMASFPAAREHRVRQAEGPLLMVTCISNVFQALIRCSTWQVQDEKLRPGDSKGQNKTGSLSMFFTRGMKGTRRNEQVGRPEGRSCLRGQSSCGWTKKKVQQSEMGNPEQTHGDGGQLDEQVEWEEVLERPPEERFVYDYKMTV